MPNELFEKLKALNLPEGGFAIFGSGPMAARGIRESHDLDVIVTQDIYNEYKNKAGWEEKMGKQDKYLEKNGIEFWYNWRPGEWDVGKLIQEAEMIDGLPFVRLEEVLIWKKAIGREKDLADIKLIKEHIK